VCVCARAWEGVRRVWIDITKNEGPHPKKFTRKSRNSCAVNSGGVGAHGQLTRGSNGLSPEMNTTHLKSSSISCLVHVPLTVTEPSA